MRASLDTNAYVAFRQGHPGVLEIVRGATGVLLSPIVLGELAYGFRNGTKAEANLRDLLRFLSRPGVTVPPVTQETSDRYGRVAAALRRKGRPIPTNDVWIAAHALETGATVVTFDRHFEAIDGLAVIDPSA